MHFDLSSAATGVRLDDAGAGRRPCAVGAMQRTSFAKWPCSIARTMDPLGDQWTPLVLREAFDGIRRFDEFQDSLGIARNTLTDRLRRLVGARLLEKRAYQREPVRYDYVLTEKGRDLSACWSRCPAGATAGWPATRSCPSCCTTIGAVRTPIPKWCARRAASRAGRGDQQAHGAGISGPLGRPTRRAAPLRRLRSSAERAQGKRAFALDAKALSAAEVRLPAAVGSGGARFRAA